MKRIAILPGDGIGPEVMQEALKVLDATQKKFSFQLEYEFADVGGCAIDKHGEALPSHTVSLCESSDAILFGSVGGPKWESLPPEKQPERAALLPLRKHFKLFCNLRPARVFKALAGSSPLHPDIVGDGFDILCVRELTGGIYFGQPKGRQGSGPEERAFDTMVYTREEIERIARMGFTLARKRRKKVTSVDKANVLTTMVFWREVVTEVGREYEDIELNHMYVDNATMQLVKNPHQFDVLLCGNMFGDIITDIGAIIQGGLGIAAGGNINPEGTAMFEPIGGSAPKYTGMNKINPLAAISAVQMMLEYLGENDAAKTLLVAIKSVLRNDLKNMEAGKMGYGTSEVGDLIVSYIHNHI